MKVNDTLIAHLASLSKLDFDDSKREEIKNDLEKILSFMEKLSEVDTSNVEPLIYINEEVNVFREDEVNNNISKEEALMNAPSKDSDFIKVPKVIQKK